MRVVLHLFEHFGFRFGGQTRKGVLGRAHLPVGGRNERVGQQLGKGRALLRRFHQAAADEVRKVFRPGQTMSALIKPDAKRRRSL